MTVSVAKSVRFYMDEHFLFLEAARAVYSQSLPVSSLEGETTGPVAFKNGGHSSFAQLGCVVRLCLFKHEVITLQKQYL